MGATIACAKSCGAQLKSALYDGSDLPAIWVCGDCAAKMPAKVVGGADYGPTCEARFALPVQVCKLPPDHAGDHDAMVRGSEEVKRLDLLDETIEILNWARGRPGVLRLLWALRTANYDETGTEYLRRVVDGRGASGERSVPPVGGMMPIEPPCLPMPQGERRCELRGDLVEPEAVHQIESCSCTFVQVSLDDIDAGKASPSCLYDRRQGAECEVHGGAAVMTHDGGESRLQAALFGEGISEPPAPSVEPTRPGSMGSISHEPGCPCSECANATEPQASGSPTTYRCTHGTAVGEYCLRCLGLVVDCKLSR